MFLAEHKQDITNGELVAVKRLLQLSAKYAVCQRQDRNARKSHQ